LDGDQGKHAVDDSLLVELNVARSSANALLTAERMAQGSAVDDVLTARSDAILHIDPTFSLEIAFFRWLAGAGGPQVLQGRVLDALPRSKGIHSAKQVASKIEQINASPLYGFVSREGQTSVNIAGEFVTALANLRMPTLKAAEGHDFLLLVKERLCWLVNSQPTAGASDAPVLNGAAALTAMFQVQVDKTKGSEEVTLGDLQVVHAFHWLLNADQVGKLQQMVSGIYKTSTGAGPAGATVVHKRKTTVATDATAKKAAATAATMSLFSNKK